MQAGPFSCKPEARAQSDHLTRRPELTTSKTTTWSPNPANQRVLKIDAEEIANFETQVQRFKAGDWETMEFTRFRLRQGIL